MEKRKISDQETEGQQAKKHREVDNGNTAGKEPRAHKEKKTTKQLLE